MNRHLTINSFKITACVLILFLTVSCQQNLTKEYKTVSDNYTPTLSKEAIYTKLNRIDTMADSTKQRDSITAFFSEWHRLIPSNSSDFINQNDTLSAIFSVYNAIFQPFDLYKLGKDWEPRNKLDSSISYLTIQNQLLYSIVDSIGGINSFILKRLDTLTNFRPPLDIGKTKILYLTKEYEAALQNFLGIDSAYASEYYIADAIHSYDNTKHYDMVKSFMPIRHSSSAGFWILKASPYIQSITLNKTLSRAIVHYSVGYQGGMALVVKLNGRWTIRVSELTWME